MLSSTKKKTFLVAFSLFVAMKYLVLDRHTIATQPLSLVNHSVGHKARISRVYHICTQTGFGSLQKGDNLSSRLIYSDKYKLAYISIPKIGSTFLKKFFYVLRFGPENAHKIFNRMRSEVHAVSGELVTRLNTRDLNHVMTLITARNPYTRLYSAYIDKVHLPLALGLGKGIIFQNYMVKLSKLGGNSSRGRSNAAVIGGKISVLRQQPVCTKDISFQDFLEFALSEPLRGKAMYDHFCPVSLLLSQSICNLKHLLILKQETFADDIEYVLKVINADDSLYKLFHRQLYKDHTKSTISSVVESVYSHVRMQSEIWKVSYCWTMPLIMERLWKSFQIQGVINEKSDFPKFRFSEKSFYDSGYIIKIMLDEVERNPLSQIERDEQRKRAFFKAYTNISSHIISKIREVYVVDFQMFGYDIGPFDLQN